MDFIFGKRLDILIAFFFGGTIGYVQGLINSNQVLINQNIAVAYNFQVNLGDFIQIQPITFFNILKTKHFFKN